MKLPRLKEVRELHGWSQARLAEESGVSRDSISNYETGQREAWPATAKKLADALGVEIGDLARPKATAPSTSGQPEEKWTEPRDIARDAARREFELDSKAARRTLASEGVDRAARISDIYEPIAYSTLKRRPRDEVAGALMDAEQDIVYLQHENVHLKQEIARLKEEAAKLHEQAASVE